MLFGLKWVPYNCLYILKCFSIRISYFWIHNCLDFTTAAANIMLLSFDLILSIYSYFPSIYANRAYLLSHSVLYYISV